MSLSELTSTATILDGAVTFHMMPYFTMDMRIKYQTIRKSVDESKHTYHFNVFSLLESVCQDIVFNDTTSNPHIRALQMYWERRTKDISKNWEMYNEWVSPAMNDLVWGAYEVSQYEIDKPPGLLGEAAPDRKTEKKDSSNIGKKSKK